MRKIVQGLALTVALAAVQAASGAVGCTLNNPARDLKTLFPDMTSYREDVRELRRLEDGRYLYGELRARLGDDLDPVYESLDTPYTLYSIYRGERRIGYVHGVNVRGRGGVIQVFLALDPEMATIIRLFFQRLESPGGAALRRPEVTGQFAGLSLADFYKHDFFAVGEPDNPTDRVGRLALPANVPAGAAEDWKATLRGVRKNLILMDIFAFDRRHEPFRERALQALEALGKERKP